MLDRHRSNWALTRRAVFAGALVAAFAGVAAAQGFDNITHIVGVHPHTVALKRILPAVVNLNGKTIEVHAKSLTGGGPRGGYVMPDGTTGITANDVEVLKLQLTTAIQKDNRFMVVDSHPETILDFSVTEYYVERHNIQFGNQTCTNFTGKMEVSYSAKDARSGVALDSENLSAALSERAAKGPGTFSKVPLVGKKGACNSESAVASPVEARDALFGYIVAEMARRVAPTEETVVVAVPHGKLDRISNIASSGRWETLVEEAEKMDKFPKPQDDAYRVYLIGLGNEGLAYDAARDAAQRERTRRNDMTSAAALQSIQQENKDYADAQDYIDKAAKAYKDAIQLKPDEKYFREPDARIEGDVKLYATIMRHKEEYRQAVLHKQGSANTSVAMNTPAPAAPAAPPAANTSGSRSVATPAPAKPAAQSSYDRVIQMCQQKVPGVSQLIHDHPTDLRFSRSLTLDEDLAIRKECGGDGPKIVDEINAQLRRRGASKKSGGN